MAPEQHNQHAMSPKYFSGGERVALMWHVPQVCLKAIDDIQDCNLRQHARDALSAAVRLQEVSTLFGGALYCARKRVSIDDETQDRISKKFPRLASVQTVLDGLARRTADGRLDGPEPF